MLEFIGTGSAFNTKIGNNAAYIKQNGVLFLIDCGSTTFSRIQTLGLLEDVTKIYVLVTHTHPDHVGSLGDLIFYGYYNMGNLFTPSVHVLAPEAISITKVLEAEGILDNTYELTEFGLSPIMIDLPTRPFKINFQAVPVEHVAELSCFGYKIEFNNKKIYYSGDSHMIPTDILEDLHTGVYDYFYQDTCKAHYPGNVHLSLENLSSLVKPEVRNRVYCMHLDKKFDTKEAEDLGFNVVVRYQVDESHLIPQIVEMSKGTISLNYLKTLTNAEIRYLFSSLFGSKVREVNSNN